jgi:broad specificity phosphatase PhoE
MQLYFIRHGQAFINLPHWTDYSKEWGLTDLGHQQAAAAGQWIAANLPEPDIIYASTMKRAHETAQHIGTALDKTIDYDDRLREIGNNRHDHTPWPSDDLPPYGEYWASEHPFRSITPSRTNGESMMHFRTRIGMFIEDVLERHPAQVVFIVCHGFVIDTVFDIAFNVGAYRRCEVWTHNTGIAHFEHVHHIGRETWRLHRMNWSEHLNGIEAPLTDTVSGATK